MADILATVSGQSLVFTSMPVIASHGVNEDYVEFTFDAEWTGYSKVATFYHERFPEDIYVSVVGGSNRALVPHEVTANAGRIFIGVTGTQGDVKLTSEVQPYPILPGSNEDGVNSEPITPELYDQILSAMAEMVGTPLTANTAADMTDTTRIYVYTGSEAGYVNGSWYYYNGSSWVVGGVYNSQGISDAFYNDIADLVKQSAVASESDSVPYLYRPTPNPSAILADEEIVGGTIAWNQLVQTGASTFNANRGTKSYDSDTNTFSVAFTSAGTYTGVYTTSTLRSKSNHVYLIRASVNPGDATAISFGVEGDAKSATVTANAFSNIATLSKNATDNKAFSLYALTSNVSSGTVQFRNIQVFDVTAYFGTTSIADYLYTLESGTAGAGVAKLREWGFLLKDYFAYDAGSLQSVNTEGKEVVGKNLFNLKWFAEQHPTYCTWNDVTKELSVTANSVLYNTGVSIDAPFDIGGTGRFTFEAKCGSGVNLRFRIYYSDGTYTETAGIGSTITFAKQSQSISNKRVVSVRMNWSTAGTFVVRNTIMEFGDATSYVPYRSTTYPTTPTDLNGIFKLDANNQLYADGDRYKADGTITRNYTYRDYEAGDESLANAITDGVHTVVKKNSPTTETADPYAATQIVGKGGTERWIDNRSVPVPVGHRTTYSIGVPDVPANANNATLHVTVSGGRTTLTWS